MITDNNPLLAISSHPQFDRITPEHVEPAIRHILAEAETKLAALEDSLTPSWRGLMRPLYELGRPLNFAWSLVSHLLGVMNNEAWREAHQKLQPDVVAFGLRLGQSKALYDGMLSLQQTHGKDLSPPQKRILESSIRAARLAGVGLPPEQRDTFNANRREMAKASTQFQNHLLDATKSFALDLNTHKEADGLPPSLLQMAAQAAKAAGNETATPENGPWRITLEIALFSPFMKYSTRRDLREQLYRAYVTRASRDEQNNQPLIDKILTLREQQARLLGFRSYAELSLESKMAPSVTAVDALHERLRTAAHAAAIQDFSDLTALASEQPDTPQQLLNWDIAYWAERLREKRFHFNDEDLRPYFPFPHVLKGLFSLCNDLFGIRVEAADGEVPVWHPDVRFFNVFNENNSHIASFYLDPYSRPETKRGGAWMNPAAPRDGTGEAVELPVVYLACNQTPPSADKPSLMTFTEVSTLFHEFGHGLQHMLTTVDEPDASGLHNIEWDAVELASQFMENWLYHKPTLQKLSRHIETQASIPDELFERIAGARIYRAGSDMLRQLFYGMTDMALHHRDNATAGDSVTKIKNRIAEKTLVLPLIPEDRSLCGFAHIFGGGYAAGYYSYKWAEVLSADAFAAFEEAGLNHAKAISKTGRKYRDTILALGGEEHPMDIFRRFRGHDPDPTALLRHCGLFPQEQLANSSEAPYA